MSKIFVDQVDPKTGTSLTLGTSGDTVNIPSGVTLANAGTVTGLPASAISSGTIATARLGSGTASSSTFSKRRSNVCSSWYVKLSTIFFLLDKLQINPFQTALTQKFNFQQRLQILVQYLTTVQIIVLPLVLQENI